jgi:hypothetical protein
MRKILLVPFVFLPLSGCGPVPVDQAEQTCLEQARGAEGPTGSVSIQIDNKGHVSTGVEIGVSIDYLAGRDPAQVYDECVYRASGQWPIHPYYTQVPH